MAEKQTFVQIVDQKTGLVERVADMKEILALSVEDKLSLARTKTLYVVSHKLEPVIKVEMRKVSLAPVSYKEEPKEQPKPQFKPKAEKMEKQAEIAIKTGVKGKPKKK